MTPNFDRIAPFYRWLEYATLGPLLERTRSHHLPALAGSSQALILGDGDGRFTAALLARYPQLQAHAVDCSARMIALLRARTHSPKLRTTVADALTLSPHPAPDLLITHFFLDCLTQAQANTLIPHLAAHAAPQARWLVSEFAIPPGPLGPVARLYIRALYLAFRVLTGLRVTRIPDYATPLTQAGFRPAAEQTFLFGLLSTTLWQRYAIQPPMNPATEEPQSDPEPAPPSLDHPDPAVYKPDEPVEPAQN
jgi:ubiquinone/menaquinone biosynthesis C-methylase UbiE